MHNKLEEKINNIIAEAQRKTDAELENEASNYYIIRAEAVHSKSNIFRRIKAVFQGEQYEIEEHQTNVNDANRLAEETRNKKNDEARINTVKALFNGACQHFSNAKTSIELYWRQVITKRELSAELGYRDLLDEVTKDLRTANRIKEEMIKIQDKYNILNSEYHDIMEILEKIMKHNKAIKKDKSKVVE